MPATMTRTEFLAALRTAAANCTPGLGCKFYPSDLRVALEDMELYGQVPEGTAANLERLAKAHGLARRADMVTAWEGGPARVEDEEWVDGGTFHAIEVAL